MSDQEVQALTRELRALRADVQKVLSILHGDEGQIGLLAKVQVLWSTSTWLLCTGAAAAGSLLTWLVTK